MAFYPGSMWFGTSWFIRRKKWKNFTVIHKKEKSQVCVGIGDYFEIDPVIIRLIFLMALFVGGGLLVYIIAWIIVPKQVFEHIYQQQTSSA